jgi:hypothetical protein
MKPVGAVILLIGLALAACATPLTPEQRSRIHSVGVISLLGDQITLSYTGLFDAFHDKVPVPASQFDALAEDSVIVCAKAVDPTLEFKKVALSKPPLMDKLYGGIAALYNLTLSQIHPELSAWAKENRVDAIVIVLAINSQVPARGPSQYFSGLGLHQLTTYAPIVQESFGIEIWDGNGQGSLGSFAAMPAAGEYSESIQKVRDELSAGARLPLIPMLQRMLRDDVCKLVTRANL